MNTTLVNLQYATALDINLLTGVHQDVVNGDILQQRLQRAQTKNLMQNFPRKAVPFDGTQGRIQLYDKPLNYLPNLRPGPDVLQGRQLFQIDLCDQFAMKNRLEILVCPGRNTNIARRRPSAAADTHVRTEGFCIRHFLSLTSLRRGRTIYAVRRYRPLLLVLPRQGGLPRSRKR